VTVPRILVVDDQLATEADLRAEFCRRCGLVDIDLQTTDESLKALPSDKIAEVVFCSGQENLNGRIENSLEEIIRVVESGWPSQQGWRWALVLLDVRFDSNPSKTDDGTFGLEVLEQVTRRWPDSDNTPGTSHIPVVMLSTYGRGERGKQAGRAGARAYIEKANLDSKHVAKILDEHGLLEDDLQLLIGKSLAMLQALRTAREAARNGRGNLLILGETGTGKTALARYIHHHSPRANHSLQTMTVGAGIEPTVLYAQLFGFWYGAYTPVDRSDAGRAERAHKSTLFIDEVGNLDPASQGSLLEYGRLTPDGMRRFGRLGVFPTDPKKAVDQAYKSIRGQYDQAAGEIAVDVFLLAGTNAPLDDETYRREHGFREDLFIRLGVEYRHYMKFPSLRERREDVLPLFLHFLGKASLENNGTWPKEIDIKVAERLTSYDWPGNIAELKGVASDVETQSREWDEILDHHLRPLAKTKDRSDNSKLEDSGFQTLSNLSTLEETLREFQVPKSRVELYGGLINVRTACGRVVADLVEAALEETRDLRSSEIIPTTAMNLLLGTNMASSRAADELKRWAKLFGFSSEGNSNLAQALRWAEGLRKSKKTNSISESTL
jgi:DNA-binding NtrC family response regulator